MPPLKYLEDPAGGGDSVVVPVDGISSDGDEDVWPTHPRFERADANVYLKKLATMWMQHLGEHEKGWFRQIFLN